jgi:hydroxyacylglutathione hydrolase
MLIRRFFEPGLAQTSYLIGCAASGEAIVIDPLRDAEMYLRAAAEERVRITHVTETHIHADFLSGSRELARRTGAAMYLSDEGDAEWKYQFVDEGRPLRHGDRISVGNVLIEALHTPGHTPEHLTFLVTDGAVANAPIAAATGDFIFVGDVGRPDLLERAANYRGTMERGARTLFKALEAFDQGRDDWLQIWPGHGAGSACGKGISAVPHSTLGYERRFNWAFKTKGEEEFVRNVLAGQPEPPKYFATMKRMNKAGPSILSGFRLPGRLDDARLPALVAGGAVVIDTRPATAYGLQHVGGTLNIPFDEKFNTWAGWLVSFDEPFYLIVADEVPDRLLKIARSLALVGLDNLGGYFAPSVVDQAVADHSVRHLRQIEPVEVASIGGGARVVDVRSESEWSGGHLPGAHHIPLGYLPDRLSELQPDRTVIVQCYSGARSAIGASLLERAGFRDVRNLTGGYSAWKAAGLPVE